MAGRKQETQLRTAGGIQYELTRKRVKNLNIRVREDGTVAVSIPLRTSAGIRLLARPTPRQPALRNSGMFSGVTPPMAT